MKGTCPVCHRGDVLVRDGRLIDHATPRPVLVGEPPDLCNGSGRVPLRREHNCRFEYCTAPTGECENPE